MRRIVTAELMDQASPDPALLGESLNDLAWMNRYLGVTAGIVRQLGRLLDGRAPEMLRVLDVGAGGGDILAALAGRWERRGLAFEGVGLDLGVVASRIAVERLGARNGDKGIGMVCGDARALPFPDRSFDVAVSSTLLHHLEPRDGVLVLREMARVSALGMIVTDLRRGAAGYLAAWTLANTLWRRHRYPRHDAPTSARAAYTMAEARELAERAGLAAEIEPQRWFRWALRWRRPE
jgi:SAM-dependent methyltransferase